MEDANQALCKNVDTDPILGAGGGGREMGFSAEERFFFLCISFEALSEFVAGRCVVVWVADGMGLVVGRVVQQLTATDLE